VTDIAGNLRAVRERVARACDASGRSPDDVTIIGVSKTHTPEAIAAAHAAGLRHFGENRVQEAALKLPALSTLAPPPVWHMVGHLQRNKVREAVDLFDVIHSVDSMKLAVAMSERAGRDLRVFIEVNVGGEPAKHGVSPDSLPDLVREVRRLPHLQLEGLMTVAPIVPEPEDARPIFRQLRELAASHDLRQLSMGMTDDFEVAIEEGATFVRIGRAIFGARA